MILVMLTEKPSYQKKFALSKFFSCKFAFPVWLGSVDNIFNINIECFCSSMVEVYEMYEHNHT